MSKTSKVERISFIGRYFHSINKEDNQVKWQGVVIGKPEPGLYLVALFSWDTGLPSVLRLVRIEDMGDWLFYSCSEDMVHSYECGTAREGGPYRKREKPDEMPMSK